MLTNLAGNGVDLLGEFTRGVAGAGGDIGKLGDVIAGIIPKAIDIIMKLLPNAH